jgi:cell division protein FtsI (penicillin-binding protein 3)/stage V sporulation protein D (sporulation-specific penicillin-binding protein)
MKRINYFSTVQSRSFFIYLICGLIGIILVLRLFAVQVVQGNRFALMGQRQTQDVQKLYSPRGTIYDRNGKKLAFSAMVKSIYADPGMMNISPAEAAELLAGPLKEDPKKLEKILTADTRFVWIKRLLPTEDYETAENIIKSRHLTGFGFVDESQRYYPNGSLLANVLGFVGIDDKGLDGLEMSLDQDIRGAVIKQRLLTDGRGNPILQSTTAPYLAEKEKSVYLTIDESIQFFAERALDRAMSETHAEGGSVIVMNPKTGEILAMANRPTYNPNQFFHATEAQFKNRAVVDIYEPGSTFKPVIASAALSAGTYTMDTVFQDPGVVRASGHEIKNWNEESYGSVKLVDIIKYSINTGFAHIGLLTGGKILTDYAKKFGFGKATGIELPGEAEGILFNPEDMRPIDVATMSLGQGIAVTPLQMVQAYSALANGGQMVKPHIIASIKNADGSDYQNFGTQIVGHPITPEIADTVKGMLEKVVSEGGGQMARVEGYHMAGKTGTAQKLDTVHGGYLPDEHIASFCGFGPVEDPAAICLVVLDNPRGGNYYGGMVAAPVFSEVMGQIMRYMGIHTPDSKEQAPVSSEKNRHELMPVRRGKDGSVYLPSFAGWSIRDTGDWLERAGLEFMPDGTGYADSQFPAAGNSVTSGTAVKVHFSS